jgi:hypothetical protein
MTEIVNQMKPKRPRPPAAGKGRKRGSVNKITRRVRESIEAALNDGDGAVAFFIKLKADDPRTFAILAGRLIPIQVQAEVAQKIDNNVTITLVK